MKKTDEDTDPFKEFFMDPSSLGEELEIGAIEGAAKKYSFNEDDQEEEEKDTDDQKEEEKEEEGQDDNNDEKSKSGTKRSEGSDDTNSQRTNNSEKDSDSDSEDTEKQINSELLASFADELRSKGLIEFEDDEFEDNPDFILNKIDSKINQGIDSYKESIPDQAKEILDFLEAGGELNEYLQTASGFKDYDNIDIANENNQAAIIREHLITNLGYSKEEADDEILDYEDAGKLETMAQRYLPKLKQKQEATKRQLIEEKKQMDQARRKQMEEFVTNIQTNISSMDDIAGFKPTSEEKRKLKDYLTKPVKDGKTQYQLSFEKDKVKKLIMSGYLDMIGYNFDNLKKSARSEATSKFKQLLSGQQSGMKSSKKQQSQSDKGDYSAFRKLFS